MKQTVNERLKILMRELNLNIPSLAIALGIKESTLRNYFEESRQSKPGYEVLEKLYFSFENINLTWLFGGGGEPLLTVTGEQKTQKKNVGNTIGTNNGTAEMHYSALSDCEKDLKNAHEKIALLNSQLEVQAKYIRLLEAQQPQP